MLIGLMSLPNQVVFIQFHPVTYLVKLNIEMSMASLITRLARGDNPDDFYPSNSASGGHSHSGPSHHTGHAPWANQGNTVQLTHRSKVVAGDSDDDAASIERAGTGIHRRTDIEVKVEGLENKKHDSYKMRDGGRGRNTDDEFPLTQDAGHPKQMIRIDERQRQSSTISRDS